MGNFFENITIDNFKVFKDSAKIELAPINILTGKNNSGKSSLMQLMQLIKLSIDNHNMEVLPFSELDGLQSFDDFKTYDYNKDEITIEIPFNVEWFEKTESFSLKLKYANSKIKKLDGILKEYVVFDHEDDIISSWSKNDVIDDDGTPLLERKLFINFEKINGWKSVFYNKKINELKKLQSFIVGYATESGDDSKKDKSFGDLFPSLSDEQVVINNMYFRKRFNSKCFDEDGYYIGGSFTKPDKGVRMIVAEDVSNSNESNLHESESEYLGYVMNEELFDFVEERNRKRNFNEGTSFNRVYDYSTFESINESKLIFNYNNFDGSDLTKEQIEKLIKVESESFKTLNTDYFSFDYQSSFDCIIDNIANIIIEKLKNIGNLRLIMSQHEIYGSFSISKTKYGEFINDIYNTLLSVPRNFLKTKEKLEESDADIQKKDITSFLKPIYNNPFSDESRVEFINKWLKEFSYGDDYIIKKEGNVLNIFFNNGKDGITSYGKGLQELIYLIFKIALQARENGNKDSIMLVVEPEAHLHPNFQSLLADMFTDASSRFKIKFIIESHSEYLVKKLQYLTALGESEDGIKPGHVYVNYFDNVKEDTSSVINQITIDKYGNLSDELGEGFVDHAPNLMIDMLRLKNKNK